MENNQSEQNMEAAQAWQLMQDLLETEMPVDNGGKNNKRQYTLLLLILLIGGCGIYKLFNSHDGGVGVLSHDAVNKQKNKTEQLSANAPLVAGNTHQKQANENEIEQKDKKITVEKNTAVESKSQEQVANGESTEMGSQSTSKPLKTDSKNFIKNVKNNTDASSDILITPTAKQKQNRDAGISNLANISKPGMASHKNETKATVFAEPANLSANKTNNPGKENPITEDNISNAKSYVNGEVANKNEQHKLKTNDSALSRQVTKVENGQKNKATIKVPVAQSHKKLHFGLEWSMALPFGNSAVFKEVNGKNQPLTILIPALWVSKELSAKSTLLLSFNPYSQYLLNKRSAIKSGNYSVSTTSASSINQPANTVFIDQTFTLSKVMGIEVAMQYAYQLSRYWSIGGAVGNTWTNNALLNEKLVRNSTDVLRDSLYGVVKSDKDWQYINPHFVTGKIYLAYQFKHYRFGAAFSKPITGVFGNTVKENRPVNAQLFLRWGIK